MAFAEDLAPFFGDFAAEATLDGIAVRGILDTESDVFGADAVTQRPTFLLEPGSAASPAVGQALVLDAVSYSVRRVLSEPPDGVLTRLVLVRA